jgi:hypothetical protein
MWLQTQCRRPVHLLPCRPTPLPQRFHLILNLALGSQDTAFTRINGAGVSEEALKGTLARPRSMLVDWVKVWGLPA